MKKHQYMPTLDRPATYEIKVLGHLDESLSDWIEEMTITFDSSSGGSPVTTLTCTVDQAALLGLLRRFYSLGIHLISVNCVAGNFDE
jgi:hypothetical protein